jgi:hypothetical protein
MKLRLYSDLHTEFEPFDMPVVPDEKDTVLLLAGDIAVARKNNTLKPIVDWAARHAAVIYVPGNHEYYGGQLPAAWQNMEEYFEDVDNLFMLNPGRVEINNHVFLGATLWTSLQGTAGALAGQVMNDYRVIGIRDKNDGDTPDTFKGKLNPHATTALHREHREYLFTEVAKAKDMGRKVVVVTHHAPSPQSTAEQFMGDPLNAAYHTDLEKEIIETEPDLWVHGHVHNSFEYHVGKTHVITNPKGYPGHYDNMRPENPGFVPDGRLGFELD